MKYLTLIAATAGVFMLSVAIPVHARTIQTECQVLFDKADENNDGTLGNGEINPFAEPVEKTSSLSQPSAVLSEQEFMVECGAHVLQKMPANQLAMVLLLLSASAGATGLLSPE